MERYLVGYRIDDEYSLSTVISRDIDRIWREREASSAFPRLRAVAVAAHAAPRSARTEELYDGYREDVLAETYLACEDYISHVTRPGMSAYARTAERVTTLFLWKVGLSEGWERLRLLESMFGERTGAGYLRSEGCHAGGPRYQLSGSLVEGSRGGLLQLWRKDRQASPAARQWREAQWPIFGEVVTYEIARHVIRRQLDAERSLWRAAIETAGIRRRQPRA
jgi:hypothetical protein